MFRSTQSFAESAQSVESEELFSTHKQLATRFMWHQKLFMASRVALIVAVVGLVLYLLFAHKLLLQFSPLAFLLALLLPNRGGLERALEHIDEDIGLSYRTALEYEKTKAEEAKGKEETEEVVDFSSLLLKRAKYRVRNLDLPDLQPWWLPMLVTSVVLSLVPFFLNATPLNFGGRGLLGNTNLQNPLNRPPQNQEPLAEEQAATEEEEAVDELAEEEASEVEGQNQDDADLESSFEDSTQQPDRRVSEAEGETLSRFLDNLKEKPQSEEERLSEQARRPGGPSEEPPPDSEMAEDPEQRTERSSENTSQENNGESQDGENSETEYDNQGEEGQQQANDDSAGGEQDENATLQDGENNGEDTAEVGARPDEGGLQPSDDDSGFSGEDNENGIGNGASEATASSEERLQGPRQAPELLEGEIRSDETTIAGEVRLPGSDQIDVPEGTSSQEFDKAVERAIAEGRIPVEYQEILKNYFR